MNVKLVSVVVPCYNEKDTLREFYRQICVVADSLAPRGMEILFVDDGSTDGSPKILDEFAKNDKRVCVLHLAANRGHQTALTAGMDYVTGDMVVTIDSDLQDPPELILQMVEKIEQGWEVVHGRRVKRQGDTLFKKVTAHLFYKAMRYFSDAPIVANSGDFRAFSRRVLEAVRSFRAHQRFWRGAVAQIGFSQCIIDYDRTPRYGGNTKYPFWTMFGMSVDALLGFSAVPIRFIMMFSFLLWGVSLVYLGYALLGHYFFHSTVRGWTSIVLLQFFFTGLVLFCIAIVGSYVGRIYQQNQDPPLYWLKDVKNIDLKKHCANSSSAREVALSCRIVCGDTEKKD